MPCPLHLPEKPRGMRKCCLSFAGLPKRALTPHARGSEILQWAQGSHGGEAQREVILGTRSERKRRRKPCPRQRKRRALYSTPALHGGKQRRVPSTGQAAKQQPLHVPLLAQRHHISSPRDSPTRGTAGKQNRLKELEAQSCNQLRKEGARAVKAGEKQRDTVSDSPAEEAAFPLFEQQMKSLERGGTWHHWLRAGTPAQPLPHSTGPGRERRESWWLRVWQAWDA